MWQPPQPIPGVPVKAPHVPPAPGQVIVSYEVNNPETGCCKCDTLSTSGLIALVVLVLLFWPLAFLPCVMADCHTQTQRPVYGFPPGQAPVMMAPMAQPVYAPPPMAQPVYAPPPMAQPKEVV